NAASVLLTDTQVSQALAHVGPGRLTAALVADAADETPTPCGHELTGATAPAQATWRAGQLLAQLTVHPFPDPAHARPAAQQLAPSTAGCATWLDPAASWAAAAGPAVPGAALSRHVSLLGATGRTEQTWVVRADGARVLSLVVSAPATDTLP